MLLRYYFSLRVQYYINYVRKTCKIWPVSAFYSIAIIESIIEQKDSFRAICILWGIVKTGGYFWQTEYFCLFHTAANKQ